MKIQLPIKFGLERMKDGSERYREAWHRRLSNWEVFDEITMKVVPRYRTGGKSGSEWRTAVKLELKHKGEVIVRLLPQDVRSAIMVLGAAWIGESLTIPDEILELEKVSCDQPGCSKKANNKFVLKHLVSDHGELLDMREQYELYYRQFCDEHVKRGDANREDCDSNYDPVDNLFTRDTVTVPKVAGVADKNPTVLVSAIDLNEFVEKIRKEDDDGEKIYNWNKKFGGKDP